MSCCQWIYIAFLLSRARQSMIDGYGNEFGWRGQESLTRDSSPEKTSSSNAISFLYGNQFRRRRSMSLSFRKVENFLDMLVEASRRRLHGWKSNHNSQIGLTFPVKFDLRSRKAFSLNIYVLLWVSWGSPYTKYKSTDPDGIGEGSHESAQAKGKPIRIDFRRSVFHRETRFPSNNKGMSIIKA